MKIFVAFLLAAVILTGCGVSESVEVPAGTPQPTNTPYGGDALGVREAANMACSGAVIKFYGDDAGTTAERVKLLCIAAIFDYAKERNWHWPSDKMIYAFDGEQQSEADQWANMFLFTKLEKENLLDPKSFSAGEFKKDLFEFMEVQRTAKNLK